VQFRRKYLTLACNCHLYVEWDSVEFGVGQSETVGNMITTKRYQIYWRWEGVHLQPKEAQRGMQSVRYQIRIRSIHETGNNEIYHVLCPRITDVLLDLDLVKSPL
jgi:hypothetical protein